MSKPVIPSSSGHVWTPSQQQVLTFAGSNLVVGTPGSGKTALLLAQAEYLANHGHKVGLATFSFRSHQYLKAMATPSQAAIWNRLSTGTLRDLAIQQLHIAGQSFSFASNNQVREILRSLIPAQAFPGTLEDAEHILRTAKARAKKLPESDRYYPFVEAYKARLEELGLADRHDIIRRHVIGMRDGSVPPLPITHLLLDNVQDATELQLIWLQMHMAQGVTLKLTGDDDVTAFGQDGAQGPKAIETIESWSEMTRFNLAETHRLAPALVPAIDKIARQLRTRVAKTLEVAPAAKDSPRAQASLRVEVFPNAPAEHVFLAEICQELLGKLPQGQRTAGAGHQIGILTRTHFEAARISHALRRHGLNPASYARLIWEERTPQIILSLLYLMLGQGNNGHLHMVLLGFGVPASTVAALFRTGLRAEVWAASGFALPQLPDESPTTWATLQQVRRAMRTSLQLLQAPPAVTTVPEAALTPRMVFKALVAELLPHLPPDEHPYALLATDMLLNLSGKLTDVLPRVRTETLPDMASPIVVAPVRETRNQQFGTVIIPYASADHWPKAPSKLMGTDADHERRLFYLAISRSAGSLIFTRHQPEASPLVLEIQQSLKQQARKAA
jgi:DNA helicase II / ATP-dependent DNA helicase PcrA